MATSLIRRAGTGGMATYTRQLLRHLAELRDDLRLTVFVHASDTATLNGCQDGIEVVRIAMPRRQAQYWEQVVLPFALARFRGQLDLVHFTAYAPPVLCPLPCVATMLDLTYRRVPDRDLLRRFYWTTVAETAQRRAAHVIAISEHSRKEAECQVRIPGSRITVTYLAADQVFRPIEPMAARRQAVDLRPELAAPYLLFVGSVDRNKNLERTLLAFLRALRSGVRHRLVVAGQGGDYCERIVKPLAGQLGLVGHVIFLGKVPGELLPALYSASDGLVFPSLNEGFGLPVLEAMACGAPVLTARGSSLVEVAGDAALLVDPQSVDEIAAGICRLATEPQTRSDLTRRGLDRARQFSWQRCAMETLDVYRQVV